MNASTTRIKTNLPFHQMERLKKAWNQRVSRKNFESSNYFYVYSDNFLDSDNSKPDSNTPLEYQKKRVWKVDYSQRKFGENVPKRISMASVKARTDGTDIHISGHDNAYSDDDTNNASISYNPNQDYSNNSNDPATDLSCLPGYTGDSRVQPISPSLQGYRTISPGFLDSLLARQFFLFRAYLLLYTIYYIQASLITFCCKFRFRITCHGNKHNIST